ncbi:Flagellar basal-body rod protein FlgF [Tepidanaerobacter acetatoxydans Re1]|uniref:Flagellar basal-body rod protein FlgF n=1 Tax=Tepidanaerobacter acetatoxydans (strain DSM 21804 / JCM 16047 / Re1) TaxID=1209989 RepID=F4LR40_TEPAE|nr:flagellar basal-body rod protein FlgF [Tepidanaerobacter acetatoxydans]AEE92193.1 flagellar basal-body rod protein FlgF [Tepidanaerobacter acetatoxydans Re1]CCP27060.1 Flagellar basal-body rod protein FlgF [Tepidanaerobacter acetatoxydans Re1]
MIRGLYTGASGMLSEMSRTDVISNNLANVNTSGFKKDRAIFRALPEMNIHRFDDPITVGLDRVIDPRPFIGMLGTGVMLDEINTDFSQGAIKVTSNPLDIALRGEGFFEVQTPEGIRYTRDGSFTIDRDGYIVTKDGYYVLGENGPMLLPQEGDVVISQQGEVTVSGQFVDRLEIVNFADQGQVVKQGSNLYNSQAPTVPTDAEVIQGALEGSNTNTISEMVDLITAFRAYEASQKVIQTHDETLDRAVNDIASI